MPPATDAPDAGRYERKFHEYQPDVARIEYLIRLHPLRFRVAYPNRVVNNVYLDAPGLRSFHQHIQGTSRRSKLRLRWYGEPQPAEITAPALEVKLRDGQVGTKRRFSLLPCRFNGSLDLEALLDNARRSGVDQDVLERLAGTIPSLLNRYTRRYYESADRRFRLTIDSELYFSVANDRYFSYRRFHLERHLLVLELKYGAAHDFAARRAIVGLPLRLAKVSKYVLGLERLGLHAG